MTKAGQAPPAVPHHAQGRADLRAGGHLGAAHRDWEDGQRLRGGDDGFEQSGSASAQPHAGHSRSGRLDYLAGFIMSGGGRKGAAAAVPGRTDGIASG